MKKALLIRQRDSTDCGAACIASVCAYYKLNVRVSQVRLMAGTDKYGTSVFGMIEAATALGLLAKGIRVPSGSLHELPLPAIAHVTLDEKRAHFIVLVKVSEKQVTIMDPAEGRFSKITKEEFNKIWKGIIILMIPGESFSSGCNQSTYARFRLLAVPHSAALILAFGLAAIAGITGLTQSIYVKKIVDISWDGKNAGQVDPISAIAILLLAFHLSVSVARGLLILKTGRQINKKLIVGYYHHLLHLPQTFFDSMRVGEIISRINDAVRISAFISEVAVNLVLNTIMVVFAFAVMFVFYWKLTIILAVSVPIYAALFYFSDKMNRKWQRQILEKSAALDTQLIESLNASGTIKRFALEKYFLENTKTALGSLLQSIYTSSVYQTYFGVSADFLTKLFSIFVLWAGSYFVLQKELSPGSLIAFYSVTGYFTAALLYLMSSIRPVRDTLIAADRLFEIMDLEREHSGTTQLNKVECIRFANVCYRYAHADAVLENLNFTIWKGTITGIAGKNGSGKSTMASLLQKLYLPVSGMITIDTIDISLFDNTALRKTIALVPQHTHLFSATIAENIAIGERNPDMRKIKEISDKLGLTSFVERLPQGFNTMLLEQGSNLSGGQKQVLSIARSLYREPPVLILDEATASLDPVSETNVMETLQWYRNKGNTIIVIAHRDAMLKICDDIIVV